MCSHVESSTNDAFTWWLRILRSSTLNNPSPVLSSLWNKLEISSRSACDTFCNVTSMKERNSNIATWRHNKTRRSNAKLWGDKSFSTTTMLANRELTCFINFAWLIGIHFGNVVQGERSRQEILFALLLLVFHVDGSNPRKQLAKDSHH